MSHFRDPSTEDLERLLLASLEQDVPPPRSKQALLAGLGLSAGALLTTTAASGASAGASGTFVKATLTAGGVKSTAGAATVVTALSVAKGVLTGLALGTAVAGGLAYATLDRAPARPAVAVRRPLAIVRTPEKQPQATPVAAASPEPAVVAKPVPSALSRPSPNSAPSPHEAAPVESDLAREIRNLDHAKSALSGGDPGAALGLLAQHRREFPRTNLDQEVSVLELEALVRLGQRERAAALAQAFRVQYPRSTHLLRINSLLAAP